MKLVVGLGNPGPRYAATRHNVGARVVERLAERRRIALDAERFGGRLGLGQLDDEPLALLVPGSWMNESGVPTARAVEGLELAEPARDLLVVLDDVDLPFGRLRLRARGGSGGHRGLADVLDRLGGDAALPRLRVGVGRPSGARDTADWVLERFSPDEERALPGLLDRAAEAVERCLAEGVEAAMNRVNPASE